jgi:hypothetical protein
VFSVLGQAIYQANFDANQIQFSVAHLAAGTYWMKVESNGQSQVVPLIKK